MSHQSSYRQVFKATSLFGGVQVITVLTTIIRSKFVALFLGPVGMGISSLLVSAVTLVNTISGMGLNYSAVRDISLANESGDIKKLSYTLIIFKRWTGFFGFSVLKPNSEPIHGKKCTLILSSSFFAFSLNGVKTKIS